MKAATIFRLLVGLCVIPLLVSGLVLFPTASRAQDNGDLGASEQYSREELAQLLAPIALYPDVLLSQVLMAATYPLEVVEADRWLEKHPELHDESLDDALLNQDWAPSVKALCHFPAILSLMNERLTETTSLGNAFLAQEDEVMAVVQELRAAARTAGNLSTTSQQKVVVEKETIIIEPADPRVIYVPYYDPYTVYGSWWYPAYPPYYWTPPGASIGFGVSYWPGVYFGFAFGSWSYFDWPHHYIYIDVRKRPRFVRHDRWTTNPGRWHHLPRHRRGVAYRDKPTARKYGQAPRRSRDFRFDIRGFPEPRERARRSDKRTTTERIRQEQERTLRERKERDRVDRARQEQQRVERAKQERDRAERNRRQQRRIVPERQGRKPVVRQQHQQPRDNIFNRVEDGRQERRSSERGRSSRQGWRHDAHGRDRSGDDGQDRRNDQRLPKK